MKLFAIVGLLLSFVGYSIGQCKIVQCYFYEGRNLTFGSVDPFLCTHVTYEKDEVTEKTIYANSSFAKDNKNLFSQINALKKKNPNLKIWFMLQNDFRDQFFFDMYKNSISRNQFIQETIKFLRQYNFDGLEILVHVFDNSRPEKSKFVLLLQEMWSAFRAEKPVTGNSILTLAVWIHAQKKKIDNEYDIPGVSRYTDYIILGTVFVDEYNYLLYRHSAPLYGQNTEDTHSVDFYARYIVSKGAEKRKLILSLATGGRYFVYGSFGKPVFYLLGTVDYGKVCSILKRMVPQFDNVGMVPYAESKYVAIKYEDENSLTLKVNYVKKQGYAGVSVLSLDYDDFLGVCNKGKFPLVNTIKKECSRK